VTRRLVLVRHAKSAWPDVPDQQRPLAKRGRRDAPAAGRWLRENGFLPDRVLCSTARRTRETWQLMVPEFGKHPPAVSYEDRVYAADCSSLLDLARQADEAVSTLMIVGHNPGIEELAMTLAAAPRDAGSAGALQRAAAKFPTAAIAVLEFDSAWSSLGPGSAQIIGFVTPADLGPA
jgi:phosphohistidine phosphatase